MTVIFYFIFHFTIYFIHELLLRLQSHRHYLLLGANCMNSSTVSTQNNLVSWELVINGYSTRTLKVQNQNKKKATHKKTVTINISNGLLDN